MTPHDPPLTRLGKIRYGLAALLLGLPLPIVLIAFLRAGVRQQPLSPEEEL